MDACDVLIVGGGPAGSACARKLWRAGLDVVIADKAVFPRDKVCAGWITPQVLFDLDIDPDEYRATRTFQPITGFRVGVIGSDHTVDVFYRNPVSFGIRRCEFDDYLLRRSGARLLVGAPVSALCHDGPQWVVNQTVRAPMLVGAGGHFCPVARMLNETAEGALLIAAQEVELAIQPGTCSVLPERPELYFSPDLAGYGWCFRKGDYLNVGFGSLQRHALPKSTAEFVEFLRGMQKIPAAAASWRWRGHAYLLSGSPGRRVVADGLMLVGDAAGLAYPRSGEGIRPAIESGLMAASTIVEAGQCYSRDRLAPDARRLQRRFGDGWLAPLLSHLVPGRVATTLALRLLDTSWFVRRVVLDRWFLHARDTALAA